MNITKIKGIFPYTLALFLNAFTDLGHKIIIQNTVFKIYDDQTQIIYTAILNALILLPFIFLFTPSGYLSHRFSKVSVMRYGAFAAVIITLLITYSYYQGWFWSAFFLTFILAAQSAIYSPAKYGYIKEIAGVRDFSSLNALVQSVTTVAILSGIIAYTVMFENSLSGNYDNEAQILRQIAPLGWLLVIGSIFEFILTLRLQSYGSASGISFNIKKYLNGYTLRKNWILLRRKPEIFEAILFLSLFWSISQVILAAFGAYAKSTLGIENTIIVQGLMALAAFGIIIGSVIAARLSRHYLHKGVIVAGAVKITIMLILLPLVHSLPLIGLIFFGFGIGGAMMIVSLNALILSQTPRAHLAYVLSGNNWIQNIFMTLFLVLTTLFAYAGWDALMLFYAMLFVSLLLSTGAIIRYKEYFIWLIFERLLALRYNIIPMQTHNVPSKGAVLLLGNHISWIDWILVQIGVERRIRYLMERSIYEKKLIKPIMRLGEVIPISARGAKEAFKQAQKRLQNGEIIGIFPEGSISSDGEVGTFLHGYKRVSTDSEGVIIPFYIDGVYGSLFSRSRNRHTPSRTRFRRNIRVIYGEPLPMNSEPQTVYNAIISLKETHGAQ
ncbi:MFS transporter [Sulfuricurvum sp.]|uniref:MFS transporter n=1 Tax=Sulfuricurvum sp. TaxID=2025608 RepID=UPI00286DD1CF|nr:MFS transporter [Sulfuricurvum sp.]